MSGTGGQRPKGHPRISQRESQVNAMLMDVKQKADEQVSSNSQLLANEA